MRPEGVWIGSSPQLQGLFWYLAAHPDQLFTRVHLGTLLWGERSEEAAEGHVGRALWTLRQELGVWPMQARGNAVGWDSGQGVWHDIVAFETMAERGGADGLLAAVGLRRGALLEGFELPEAPAFGDWLQRERTRWDRRVLAMLGALAVGARLAGNWEGLASLARTALKVDPLDQRFHRSLMQALAEMGDRAGALAQFDQLLRVLVASGTPVPEKATISLRNFIAVNQVTGGQGRSQGSAASRPRECGAARHALVGRDDEMEAVWAWLGASASRSTMLFLQGEAGAGKSQLLDELLFDLERKGDRMGYETVLRAVCHQSRDASPLLGPVLEALCPTVERLGLERLPLTEEWISELKGLLQGGSVARPVEAVTRLLCVLPGRVLLVIEELQWADPGTVELLGVLGARRGDGGAAVLVTARDAELSEPAAALFSGLRAQGRLHDVLLKPLGIEAIGEMVSLHVPSADLTLAEQAHSLSRGNPLFAREWLRYYVETGGKVDRLPDQHLPLTSRIQPLVRARVALLDDGARVLLEAASLFPGGANRETLGQIAELPDEHLRAGLKELVDRQFLSEGADGSIRFCSETVRWALHAALFHERRAILYRRAARLKEEAAGAPRREAAATAQEQGVAAAVQAPAVAESVPDWAVPHISEAERLGGNDHRLKDGLTQLTAVSLSGQLRRVLGMAEWMVPLLRLTGSKELVSGALMLSALSHLSRGQLTETERGLEEAVDVLPPMVTRSKLLVLTSLTAVQAAVGRFATAEQRIADILAAERSAVPQTQRLSAALGMLAGVAIQRGQWQRVVDLSQEGIRQGQLGQHRFEEYWAMIGLGPALANLGDIAAAMDAQRRCLALVRSMQTEYALDLVYSGLAQIYAAGGDALRAEEAARAALRQAREASHKYGVGAAIYGLGLAARARGEDDRAVEQVTLALGQFESIGARPAAARCRALLSKLVRAEPIRSTHARIAEYEFRSMGMEWDRKQMQG